MSVWVLMMGVIFLNPNHADPAQREELIATRYLAGYQKQKDCQQVADAIMSDENDDYRFFYNEPHTQSMQLVFGCVERSKS